MNHEHYMNMALDLAKRGQGWVEPNPMVGAVIVREGKILGQGWHARFGGPHAEVNAIDDCKKQGHDPAGATMYVTLEPCCHAGKTSPCTQAVIEAKLAKVVIAMIDPFEQVSGKGVRELRAAGIEVELGVAEERAHEINEPFVKRVTTGLPWVILKWAQTLDGKIATASGDSRWISSPSSRQQVHELRARVDAIMVGIGTVLADDPRLTAREVEIRRAAHRVVIDPDLRMPAESKLARESEDEDQVAPPLSLAVRASRAEPSDYGVEAWLARGVGIIALPELEAAGGGAAGRSRLDLQPLLAHLAKEHHATNVLVEGGAGLAGALLEQGLVDQVLAYVAPKLMGDAEAIPAVTGISCERIASARMLKLRQVQRIGDDVLLDYRVRV